MNDIPNDYEGLPSLEHRIRDRIALCSKITPNDFNLNTPETLLAYFYYEEGYNRGELDQVEPELPPGDTYNTIHTRLLTLVRKERDRLLGGAC